MFSIELQLISLVWNPKGGSQALSIRIRGQHSFNILLTSNEIHFSHEMLCFQLNYSLSPLCRTRREEIKRSLSESGVNTFLTFSWHLAEHVFLLKCYVFNRIRPYLRFVEPEGGKSSALYENPWSIHV